MEEQSRPSEDTSEPSDSQRLASWMSPPQPTSGKPSGSDRQQRIAERLSEQPERTSSYVLGVAVRTADNHLTMSYEQASDWLWEREE